MFERILVANRGEIALRIIRAAKELGIETVAVCSETDRGSAYLELADEVICIGGSKAADSYLRIDRVISAAEVGRCQAIHPGYGLLSENAHFAEVCNDCDIQFIGPSPEAISLLGDKNAARQLAAESGVPTVPGSDGSVDTVEEAKRVAEEFEYPVLIKASAGGGGRGMRIASSEETIETAFHQAKTEAENAFGNGEVYIEKLVELPRHVEVQVLADKHGNTVHLWERDCSMQRKHQKLVEESPAPNLSDENRRGMCEAAVRLVKAANYYNAGTCEFVVDQKGNYYFIELNARIQVEHPVTEMVTGVDLIKQQFRIAAGEKLAFDQSQIEARGHAIECRINAEDPAHNFRPTPGVVSALRVPGGFGVRFDSHVHQGYTISPYYDSMVGKLIIHQPTREEAIDCMLRALGELHVEGVKTTVPLQEKILGHPDFQAGKLDTSFVERTF